MKTSTLLDAMERESTAIISEQAKQRRTALDEEQAKLMAAWHAQGEPELARLNAFEKAHRAELDRAAHLVDTYEKLGASLETHVRPARERCLHQINRILHDCRKTLESIPGQIQALR